MDLDAGEQWVEHWKSLMVHTLTILDEIPSISVTFPTDDLKLKALLVLPYSLPFKDFYYQ